MFEDQIDLTVESDDDDFEPACSSLSPKNDGRKRRRQTEAEMTRSAKTTKLDNARGGAPSSDSGTWHEEKEEAAGGLFHDLFETHGELLNKLTKTRNQFSQEQIIHEGHQFADQMKMLVRLADANERPRAFSEIEIEAIGLLMCVKKKPASLFDIVMKHMFGIN